ncbi:MAG: CDP-diacylglycerol--glycerol-3-phosphate 3-phosphatidyltransferase [Chloroflexi bacterium]|nr:MAG: CDP-diacylglycerol--glycerol-3-phosphate 3-phosphatidyltransferase [Chloroflexota bacterium]TMD65068.1 MAG: CDP-diacylglycerol--glycerol-3-phosphate 3-phosphatidyltransferase [Chloroflexota bacterium]
MPSLWAAPNLLSFSRIVAAPILYALVVAGGRYGFLVAAIIFIAASITDTLDGEIARRRHLVSPLGIYLDTTSDKILVAVLVIALAVMHLAPGWMAAVIVAREFLVTGLRSYAAALGIVIPAGGWGKAKTLITIVALLLVLLEGDARAGGWLSSQSAPGSWLLSPLGPFTISAWALLIAVVWTVGSGAEYIREAIPLLTRPGTGVVSGAADDP